ncbi:hypothetical protein GCM10010172_67140 [Paractinoplanes ferrugineus]|uniref:Uncharacterized protein n=1 Tax=Paractinoplanes ferrugineus TaxID=113564 RepID=A0A919MHY6_9ACTN|nr:hypothetical protein [Actinoplanes ferrugineus]GIE13125.1 hypothetical protein Afe05nite_49650 [Actinoplanes ferrugineus]
MKPVLLWIRRDAGWWTPALLLTVELAGLFSRGTPWRGEWAWTVDWANGMTILAGPLLAGIVAYHVHKTARRDWNPIAYPAVRTGQPILHQALADWIVACTVHLVVLLFAIGLTATTRPTGLIPWSLLPLGPVVLVAFAGIGALCGTLIRSLVAAPIAAAGAFGLTYLGATGAIPAAFRVGGATGSLVGLTLDRRVGGAMAIFLVAVALLCAAVVAVRRSPMLPPRSTAAAGVALALLATGYFTLQHTGSDKYVVDAKPLKYTCEGQTPRVCMATGTTRQLDALTNAMHTQAQVLTAAGIDIPDTFYQDVPNRQADPTQGLIIMTTDSVNAANPNPQDVADYLSFPAACKAFFGEFPPETALQARAAVADLIRHGNKLQPMVLGNDQAIRDWMDSSAASVWLKSTYDKLRTCDLAKISLPA